MNAASVPTWTEDGLEHLDVRGLPPPQPLVIILRWLQQGARRAPLLVHLERDPVMLYPELAEIGWEGVRQPGAPGDVRLLLRPS
ncbi:DUF2249 domain-containing protein [Ramlibacter tataouinensis]|uniref:DUF2249 domain-containing protein n=1 Tax=Ramlibacter tataouinensis TaxID=94132 RepID=UPI0022F3ECA1|nr:DUF2249 domain-containing protein [Ramlibacter tataouinensis]WBY03226.1 DUF2249 domain-containing protein [Ramlibacter tataouinensis]